MRIGFDISQTGASKAGCGFFADSLARQLSEIDPENEYVLYSAVGDQYWDPECEGKTFRCGRENFTRLPAPKTFEESQTFWRNPGEDFEEWLGRPDIVHVNNFFCPAGLRTSRLVYTLHDLAFLIHPEWTTESNRASCAENVFRCSVLADFVIAVSEYTRRHFLATYPHYPVERTAVVHEASRFQGAAGGSRPPRLGRMEPGKFWLSVGTLEPRKNHASLVEACARVRASAPERFPLVLAGGRGWLMDGFENSLAASGLAEDVILTGYVEEAELKWLYENCFAFVYPSRFEGFGLPVLEAMSLGAPVICSDATSLPEIAGEAAVLVDARAVESIQDAMLRLLKGEVDRARLRRLGREQARRFSWKRAAQQVLDVYREVQALPRFADSG